MNHRVDIFEERLPIGGLYGLRCVGKSHFVQVRRLPARRRDNCANRFVRARAIKRLPMNPDAPVTRTRSAMSEARSRGRGRASTTRRSPRLTQTKISCVDGDRSAAQSVSAQSRRLHIPGREERPLRRRQPVFGSPADKNGRDGGARISLAGEDAPRQRERSVGEVVQERQECDKNAIRGCDEDDAEEASRGPTASCPNRRGEQPRRRPIEQGKAEQGAGRRQAKRGEPFV